MKIGKISSLLFLIASFSVHAGDLETAFGCFSDLPGKIRNSRMVNWESYFIPAVGGHGLIGLFKKSDGSIALKKFSQKKLYQDGESGTRYYETQVNGKKIYISQREDTIGSGSFDFSVEASLENIAGEGQSVELGSGQDILDEASKKMVMDEVITALKSTEDYFKVQGCDVADETVALYRCCIVHLSTPTDTILKDYPEAKRKKAKEQCDFIKCRRHPTCQRSPYTDSEGKTQYFEISKINEYAELEGKRRPERFNNEGMCVASIRDEGQSSPDELTKLSVADFPKMTLTGDIMDKKQVPSHEAMRKEFLASIEKCRKKLDPAKNANILAAMDKVNTSIATHYCPYYQVIAKPRPLVAPAPKATTVNPSSTGGVNN